VVVRPFPIPPADMKPDAVSRDVYESLVQRRHVLLDNIDEFRVGFVLLEEDALHR
jgi:hypothetical protein